MATFPVLKTGAVAQYPLTTGSRFATQEVQFLDGSRQTYQLQAGALRRWEIQLTLLDANEVAALDAFAEGQQGNAFVFVDPISGSAAPKCVIQGNALNTQSDGECRAKVKMTILEVR